ncbi:hypothetical protein CYMTET_47570 [Cymbomonas tetramitiformis]|uniref:Uncharacterized protein n=1 Tax=Cymbomonas tetramitiformis TaxID=36881 RepID=A0AAE0EWK2_9CHLO|nr:hypothetical protein CYMTET_47570 [Cymbomonas tetramitiformis]
MIRTNSACFMDLTTHEGDECNGAMTAVDGASCEDAHEHDHNQVEGEEEDDEEDEDDDYVGQELPQPQYRDSKSKRSRTHALSEDKCGDEEDQTQDRDKDNEGVDMAKRVLASVDFAGNEDPKVKTRPVNVVNGVEVNSSHAAYVVSYSNGAKQVLKESLAKSPMMRQGLHLSLPEYAEHKLIDHADGTCECTTYDEYEDNLFENDHILPRDLQVFLRKLMDGEPYPHPSRQNLVEVMAIEDLNHPVKSSAEMKESVEHGVFAVVKIEPGMWCQRYIGKHCTSAEESHCCEKDQEHLLQHSYTFDLTAANEILGLTGDEELVVDATEVASRNHTAYVNHDREGNVQAFGALVDGLPAIFFYNSKAVQPGEELLVDYGPVYWPYMGNQRELQMNARAAANANLRVKQEAEQNTHLETRSAKGTRPFGAASEEAPAKTWPFGAASEEAPAKTWPFGAASEEAPAKTRPFGAASEEAPAKTWPFGAASEEASAELEAMVQAQAALWELQKPKGVSKPRRTCGKYHSDREELVKAGFTIEKPGKNGVSISLNSGKRFRTSREARAALLTEMGQTSSMETPQAKVELRRTRKTPLKVSAAVSTEERRESKRRKTDENFVEDGTACGVCHRTDDDENNDMLLCDGMGCDVALHLRCLDLPLSRLPDGDWHCPACEEEARGQHMRSSELPDTESARDGGHHISDCDAGLAGGDSVPSRRAARNTSAAFGKDIKAGRDALVKLLGKIDVQQEKSDRDQAALAEEKAKLARAQAALAKEKEKLARAQAALAKEKEKLARAQAALAKEKENVTKEKKTLFDDQAELTRGQEKLARGIF